MSLHPPLTAKTAQSAFTRFMAEHSLGTVATLQNVPAICRVADR